jgi:hypothetical protein
VRSRGRKVRKSSGRTRSWIVCAVLAASLWHAPIPWIHSHETLEAQGLSAAALAWHLQHLHPHGSEHAIFGWHIHLSCPWDVSNEPAPSSDPKSPKPRTVYDMPYVVSQASSAIDVDRHASADLAALPLFLQDGLASLQLDAACVSGRHFLQTDPPSVPLRALICVARC